MCTLIFPFYRTQVQFPFSQNFYKISEAVFNETNSKDYLQLNNWVLKQTNWRWQKLHLGNIGAIWHSMIDEKNWTRELKHTEELEMVFLVLQNEVVLTPSHHQDPLLHGGKTVLIILNNIWRRQSFRTEIFKLT